MTELQSVSVDIWDSKYRLKNEKDIPVDVSIEDTLERVANALASVEESPNLWEEKFLWALKNGAVPAGRILANAGAGKYKPATSTINCTVSGTIEDSMESILDRLKEAGLTLKSGCGIGYNFSTLRPRGAYVAGAGASTSGPLSFMDIYDALCFTISSAGGRRGAQMATFDISHPDVLDFIKVKQEDRRLRQFNLSLLITDDFIKAVKNDQKWVFSFEGKEYGIFPAKELWDIIMKATYDYAEPGFILIDRVNEMNNNWFCEDIRATNPCGEQPLPPQGSCLLGSINLADLVINPFSANAKFDYPRFAEVITIFTRMLDNVVEMHGLPLEQQALEIERKRRHGMGITGLGSAISMLGMKYGDSASLAFTEQICLELALTGYKEGISLAIEKGPASIMDEEFVVTKEIAEYLNDPWIPDEFKTMKGKELWANSKYMDKIWKVVPELKKEALEYGCRFTHHSSIAPTGTISLSLCNNVSNGIEPSFSHRYSRNIIKEGKATKEKVDVLSYENLVHMQLFGSELTEGTTADIDIEAHVNIQAAAQKWIDSSISKTINVPSDYPFEDFKEIYMYAYDKGLKGCTTFRFNPEVFQGVLVTDKDLENTIYSFTTKKGETVTFKGNEKVKYREEVHTVANLYDALKEGYYGRY